MALHVERGDRVCAMATTHGLSHHGKEIDEYMKRLNYYEENKTTLYSLIWGQCTDIMRAKLEALKIFKSIFFDRQ